MNTWVRYAVIGLVLVLGVIGLLWPFLPDRSRAGVVVGGAVAYPVQLVAFGLLLRYGGRLKTFLAVWVGGTLVRFAVVLGAGLLLVIRGGFDPTSLLLGLAGFFFGLLLLESAMYRPGSLGTH